MTIVVDWNDVAEEQKEEKNWKGVLRKHFEEDTLCHFRCNCEDREFNQVVDSFLYV